MPGFPYHYKVKEEKLLDVRIGGELIEEIKVIFYDLTPFTNEEENSWDGSNAVSCYSSYPTLGKAIFDWDHGSPRGGNHHWEGTACHIWLEKEGVYTLIYK